MADRRMAMADRRAAIIPETRAQRRCRGRTAVPVAVRRSLRRALGNNVIPIHIGTPGPGLSRLTERACDWPSPGTHQAGPTARSVGRERSGPRPDSTSGPGPLGSLPV